MRLRGIGLIMGLGAAVVVMADPFTDAMVELGLTELARTFSESKIEHILSADVEAVAPESRPAAAVLVAMGVIDVTALASPARAEAQLVRFQDSLARPAASVLVPLENPASLLGLKELAGHVALRKATDLMAALDAAIGEKVLTGYGLRRPHVSAASDPDRTVIYSHSSLPHVKQLVGLMASEGLRGRVYLAPKIAAFVFREGWGERPEWINELGPGIYVAQGPEILAHFEFEQAEARQRFDEIVAKFAKKDTADETGNILNAWWQPFYYCESPAEGYHEISRVTLYAESTEASLLMLPERAQSVRDHFAGTPWPVAEDSIWVSAPFFRFLAGDFK